jgi:uncharacterized protein (TIGR02271 family)
MTANIHDQQNQANIPGQQAKNLAGQQAAQQAASKTQAQARMPAEEWVERREERLEVGKEGFEAGHVKLHRYVDAEPVEKTVHLAHEEFDVERMPVNAAEPIRDTVGEYEQEITLHAERGVMRKETVPVERVRLVTKNIEEDRTFKDEVRHERIEIEQDAQAQAQAQANGERRDRPRA